MYKCPALDQKSSHLQTFGVSLPPKTTQDSDYNEEQEMEAGNIVIQYREYQISMMLFLLIPKVVFSQINKM